MQSIWLFTGLQRLCHLCVNHRLRPVATHARVLSPDQRDVEGLQSLDAPTYTHAQPKQFFSGLDGGAPTIVSDHACMNSLALHASLLTRFTERALTWQQEPTCGLSQGLASKSLDALT
jgi:hypothetical protein